VSLPRAAVDGGSIERTGGSAAGLAVRRCVMERGMTGRGICSAAALATGFGTAVAPFGFAVGTPEVVTMRCCSTDRFAGAGAGSLAAAAGAEGFGLELKSAEKMPTIFLGVFGC
jgi:hypothetical protein